VTINLIVLTIDHSNTCKKIDVQYLKSNFISRLNLGQSPLKITYQAHSDLRTICPGFLKKKKNQIKKKKNQTSCKYKLLVYYFF
jgi:hypothetical protein